MVDVANLVGAGRLLHVYRGDAVGGKHPVYGYSGHAEIGQKGFAHILVITQDADPRNPAFLEVLPDAHAAGGEFRKLLGKPGVYCRVSGVIFPELINAVNAEIIIRGLGINIFHVVKCGVVNPPGVKGAKPASSENIPDFPVPPDLGLHMINAGISYVHGEAALPPVYPADLIAVAENPEGKAHSGKPGAIYGKMKLGISDIKGAADVIILYGDFAGNGIGRKRCLRSSG